MNKQLTRREASVILMQAALIEPIAVKYVDAIEAKRWRDSCYRIKQSLAAAGDHRFSGLKFTVTDSTLTVELKPCPMTNASL